MRHGVNLRLALIVVSILAAYGCAGVQYTRDLGQKNVNGIRYYDVSPYLIATTTPEGMIDLRLEYLPDPNKKMAIQPRSVAAKVDTTFTFDRGVLTKADSTSDATVVPKAILEAAKTAVLTMLGDDPDAGAIKTRAPNLHKVPGPRVFKIIVQGEKAWLVGGDETKSFEITIQEPKADDSSNGGGS